MVGPELYFGGGGNNYVCAVRGADGNVYAPPFSAPQVLKVDCQEGSVEFIGPRMTRMPHQWRAALLAPDGFIYAPPCSASQVLKLDTNPDSPATVDFIGPEMPCDPAPEGQEKWRSCVFAADGCIYAVPSHARRLLRIKTGAFEGGSSPSGAEVRAEQERQRLEAEQKLIEEQRRRAQENEADLEQKKKSETEGKEDDKAEETVEDKDLQDDDEEGVDPEDLEEWPDELMTGIGMDDDDDN